MHDIVRVQVTGDGDDGVPRRAFTLGGADIAARIEQRRACGAMDRSIDAAASEQGGVRGVDDDLGVGARDIALDDVYPGVVVGVLAHVGSVRCARGDCLTERSAEIG